MNDMQRPTPDQLLSQIEAEERKANRGRLKIFFGSSAGVGKTYSMLSSAQEMHKQGLNIVVGLIETHSRPHTEALLKGLPVIQPLQISYHGIQIKELDLDRALELKPHTVLVDELAHTNTPGSRHPKRWNDVMELLDAGINVHTTLNVQHIESLSDLIAGTTGVWVKETVPDSIFDMADDIVLVDIDSDDLIKRLNDGNVYIAPGANKRAAENFFRKENLNALREIALRRTAERVDAERGLSQENVGKLPISEKILVCVGPDQNSAKLVRATKRMATALKAPWIALYVETGDPHSYHNAENRRTMEVLDRMVTRLDGKMVTLHGDDLVDEIMTYARKNGITKIFVGKESQLTFRNFLRGLLVDKIIRQSNSIDIIVITEEKSNRRSGTLQSRFADLKPYNYLFALVLVALFTAPGLFMSDLLTGTDQALLYLTGVVLVAERFGLWPAMFYALMAATSFNFFFGLNYTFRQSDTRGYIMTFVVMLVTGYAIAHQSTRLRRQAVAARDKEERTRALYELTRKLSSTRGRFPVAEVVCNYLAGIHKVDVTVWMINSEGHPAAVLGNVPEDTYYKDFGALQWCFDNGKNAGLGTDTMPNASGFYIPLVTGQGSLGVMGSYPKDKDRQFSSDEIASMETLASLLASSLERVRAGEIAQQSMVEKENRRLRETLMTAFKIENIAPTHETLAPMLTHGYLSDERLLRDIASSFSIESSRIKKTAMNLMEATSLQAGSMNANRVPSAIADRVEHVLARFGPRALSHGIAIDIPTDLPDVLIDSTLVEQLLYNIIDNALTYSPQAGTVQIAAERADREIRVTIKDNGTGIAPDLIGKIFDQPFTSLHETAGHAGLGLTIAAGIVRLHGGRIWAENRLGGGAQITFTLPLA